MGKTIKQIKEERGIGGPPMLRGQDVPKDINEVKIKVKELRISPDNFKSPAIIDLEAPVYGRKAFAVNITNLRMLTILLGIKDEDDSDLDDTSIEEIAKKAKGKTLKLSVALVNNPKDNKMVRSLFFG